MKFSVPVLAGILLCGGISAAQQRPAAGPVLDLKTLEAALAAKSQGAEAERLADVYGPPSEAGTRCCEAPRQK